MRVIFSDKKYWCTKCKKYHSKKSKTGRDHKKYDYDR